MKFLALVLLGLLFLASNALADSYVLNATDALLIDTGNGAVSGNVVRSNTLQTLTQYQICVTGSGKYRTGGPNGEAPIFDVLLSFGEHTPSGDVARHRSVRSGDCFTFTTVEHSNGPRVTMFLIDEADLGDNSGSFTVTINNVTPVDDSTWGAMKHTYR